MTSNARYTPKPTTAMARKKAERTTYPSGMVGAGGGPGKAIWRSPDADGYEPVPEPESDPDDAGVGVCCEYGAGVAGRAGGSGARAFRPVHI
jgi:hypothetical protein